MSILTCIDPSRSYKAFTKNDKTPNSPLDVNPKIFSAIFLDNAKLRQISTFMLIFHFLQKYSLAQN